MSSNVNQDSHRLPKVALRQFSRDGFSRLIHWAESADFLMQWAGPLFTYPLDEAQLERYLQGAQTEPPTRQVFTAVERSSGNVVGHIELNNIDRRHRSAAVSRVLIEKASQGKGYGLELVRQVTAIGFRDLHLHRLELVVFDFNQAAIACYERAGFTVEGRLREARRVGDEYWTLYLMSLLESEWDGRA